MWWGGASSRRAPSSMPVGYASQTGYQYDSISRVAGQREPAPPSKFSKEGGFKNSVFKGILGVSILALSQAHTPPPTLPLWYVRIGVRKLGSPCPSAPYQRSNRKRTS